MIKQVLHIPVLLQEVIHFLDFKPGDKVIDCTVGLGGHSRKILPCILPGGSLLALDQDQEALNLAKKNLAEWEKYIVFKKGNFGNLEEIAREAGFIPANKVLVDLGVSSLHFDKSERGFAYSRNGPLDMRMDRDRELTAEKVIEILSAEELIHIFREYGEEPYAKKIAFAIKKQILKTKIKTTEELALLINKVVPRKNKRFRHPAVRVFQALRIYVNDEFGVLGRMLGDLPNILAPGGRVGIIAFHSLEDRIVKNFFKFQIKDCLCPPEVPICVCGKKSTFKALLRKPLVPSEDEQQNNPRARSAKLRVYEKLELRQL